MDNVTVLPSLVEAARPLKGLKLSRSAYHPHTIQAVPYILYLPVLKYCSRFQNRTRLTMRVLENSVLLFLLLGLYSHVTALPLTYKPRHTKRDPMPRPQPVVPTKGKVGQGGQRMTVHGSFHLEPNWRPKKGADMIHSDKFGGWYATLNLEDAQKWDTGPVQES
ncbi:hypothetical protein CROQUDRAFT_96141 [Cronartium quercuum f. sp. fusiforme G11]|uniref:Uncharacterized protein n=1 Tax=Cronartium quercuum f. sp. fusiforme G11 TaxID=708437 RepID=A0A9P6NBG8_9BASI|nr:hypothetical protein CROQUDRAFT_96141 [Cronartium quercuum f. sp. fusiforme G11]